MRTVHKFKLPYGSNVIDIHEGAETLSVMVQDDVPCLWAIVDTERPVVKRHFIIYATGSELKEPETLLWVATFGHLDNNFIYHCFEIVEPLI